MQRRCGWTRTRHVLVRAWRPDITNTKSAPGPLEQAILARHLFSKIYKAHHQRSRTHKPTAQTNRKHIPSHSPRNPRVHQPPIHAPLAQEHRGPQPEPLHHARAERVDQHVRGRNQPPQHRQPARALRVDGQRALAAAQDVARGRGGPVDACDGGAVVREDEAREGAGGEPGELRRGVSGWGEAGEGGCALTSMTFRPARAMRCRRGEGGGNQLSEPGVWWCVRIEGARQTGTKLPATGPSRVERHVISPASDHDHDRRLAPSGHCTTCLPNLLQRCGPDDRRVTRPLRWLLNAHGQI